MFASLFFFSKRLASEPSLLPLLDLAIGRDLCSELSRSMAPKRLILMDLGDVNFILDTDSLEAVNPIKTRDFTTHEFGTIIDDIRPMSLLKSKIRIKHVFKEAVTPQN